VSTWTEGEVEITIGEPPYRLRVAARLHRCGWLAVHPEYVPRQWSYRPGWTLTHVPTGRALFNTRDTQPDPCMAAGEWLARRQPGFQRAQPTDFPSRRQVAAILAREAGMRAAADAVRAAASGEEMSA